MSERSLTELVILAKDDQEAMLLILEKFAPLIMSYAKKLFFLEGEDAKQEIVLAIIEAVNRIPKCENDGMCIAYINNAVKFRFSYLCKNNLRRESIEEIDVDEINNHPYWENYSEIELLYDMQQKRNKMNSKQNEILDYVLLGYSDREISEKLDISRQYINRIKKKFV